MGIEEHARNLLFADILEESKGLAVKDRSGNYAIGPGGEGFFGGFLARLLIVLIEGVDVDRGVVVGPFRLRKSNALGRLCPVAIVGRIGQEGSNAIVPV